MPSRLPSHERLDQKISRIPSDLFDDFIILLTQQKVSHSSVPTEAKDPKIHFPFETKSNKQSIM